MQFNTRKLFATQKKCNKDYDVDVKAMNPKDYDHGYSNYL